VYIADTNNCRVRIVVFPSTNIFNTAGNGVCADGGDGGPAGSASLDRPQGLTVDAAGDVYIADTENCRVRKVSYPFVTIDGIAGDGSCGYGGDGAGAFGAQLNMPRGVAVVSGTVRIADTLNCRVRDVSSGFISTVAGTGGCRYGGDGGSATDAALSSPADVAIDAGGNVYIADTGNCRVRKVSAGGVITTIAGNGHCAYTGEGGPAELAGLDDPRGVALDSAGNLYIADSGSCRIRRRDAATGVLTTVAGNGTCGYGGDIGPATAAKLNFPQSVAITPTGIIYIADTFNCRIRRIVGTTITTAAGNGTCAYAGDGGAPGAASLTFPYGVAVDAGGNVYIADTLSCRVRRIAGGAINLVAGNGTCGYGGDGGPAASASVNQPVGVAAASGAGVYIADTNNCRVRLVSGTTIISVAGAGTGTGFAGCGFAGDGGPAAAALLDRPQDVALDAAGDVYVSDWLNHRVRRIAAGTDVDADGVADAADNCPTVTNGAQPNNDRNFIDLPPSKSFDDLTAAHSDEVGDACDGDDDNDGLADATETGGSPCATASAATDPLLADSDGDRTLDGAECTLGYDPADPGSMPPAILMPDADSDGAPDPFDPNDANIDSDGDGARDGVELRRYNTGLTSINTDADACGDGREMASVDSNLVVNAADLGNIAGAFGPSSQPQYILDFDTDRNGNINAADLGFAANRFGSCSQ
jgi:hypothetical protein